MTSDLYKGVIKKGAEKIADNRMARTPIVIRCLRYLKTTCMKTSEKNGLFDCSFSSIRVLT